MKDNINPSHYKQGGIEPIEFIQANNMGFCEGSIVKYITRWQYKNGLEDLKKCAWYIQELIDNHKDYETAHTDTK